MHYHSHSYQNRVVPCLRLQNRRVEAELAFGIVLCLEGLQPVLPPGVVAVPLLRSLGAVGVVDVGVQLRLLGSLMNNLAQLVPELRDGRILRGAGGVVDDERGSEHTVGAESKGTGAGVDGANTGGGVILEHEDRVCVWIVGTRDGGGVEVVGGSQRGTVVVLDVDGEAGVVEAEVLARRRVKSDVCPGTEVAVGAGLGGHGQRADVPEGLGVDRVDNVDAFLHREHDDDGLVSIESGIVQPVRPLVDVGGLGSVLDDVLVGGIVDLLDLVAAEDSGLNRPVGVLDGVDLAGH